MRSTFIYNIFIMSLSVCMCVCVYCGVYEYRQERRATHSRTLSYICLWSEPNLITLHSSAPLSLVDSTSSPSLTYQSQWLYQLQAETLYRLLFTVYRLQITVFYIQESRIRISRKNKTQLTTSKRGSNNMRFSNHFDSIISITFFRLFVFFFNGTVELYCFFFKQVLCHGVAALQL